VYFRTSKILMIFDFLDIMVSYKLWQKRGYFLHDSLSFRGVPVDGQHEM
jgi:hypothetical protein